MKYSFFDSDMAMDYLENGCGKDFAVVKNLSYGIRECTVNVKNRDMQEKICKDMGLYVTFDHVDSDDKENKEYAVKRISATIQNMLGNLSQSATVLVVGLGNSSITADALGSETLKGVKSTRLNPTLYGTKTKRICTLITGVAGKTGIESGETVGAVASKIKPDAVIVVDALSTSSVHRIGASYQLTTAGISPGSGVYSARPAIDKSTLGMPVVAIGVPLVLSLRTLVYDFTKRYFDGVGENLDEYVYRKTIEEKGLSRLVVAPKDISLFVERSAEIISSAINLALK